MVEQTETNKILARDLLKRDSQMMGRQANWRNAWQDLATYLIPNAKDITTERQLGGRIKNREVYDSTAIEAASRLASSITGIITSPASQWFTFTFGEGLIKLGTASLDWLQKASQRTFLALTRSNFSIEMLQAHLQLVVFGTTAVYSREHPLKPGNLLFETLPMGTYRIQEGIDRRVDTIHREIELSLKQIAEHEEADGWVMSDKRRREWEKDPFKQIKVLHCLFPKDDVRHPLDTEKVASVYIDIEHKFVMAIEGFKELPIAVSRWMVSGRDEEYGRSPGFKALPDVLTLNKAEMIGLRSWAKSVDPPILALHQSVLGTPDLRPSRLNYILEKDALAPFPHNPNLNVDAVNRERKVSNIRSIFLMDLLQFLPGEGLTPPTATQINAQQDILLQIAGPELSRQEYELYDPTISRAFLLEMRAGEIPEPPDEIKAAAAQLGIPIDIKFEGPVAKAKRRSQIQSMDEFFAWVGQMSELYPSIQDNGNPDRAAKLRAQLLGAPLQILSTEEEMTETREARQKQAEKQAAQAQLQSQTEALKNVGGIEQLQAVEQAG